MVLSIPNVHCRDHTYYKAFSRRDFVRTCQSLDVMGLRAGRRKFSESLGPRRPMTLEVNQRFLFGLKA